MLNAKSVVNPIAVTDLDRAKRFYGEKLGFKKSDNSILVGNDVAYELPDGSVLYLYAREKPPTADSTQASFIVDDLDKALRDLKGAGIELEDYDMPGLKTEGGVAEIGGHRSAWFQDPDGNILNVHEMKS